MKHDYPDIWKLADDLIAGRKPEWWDEHGVPRFAPHSPDLCPNIYALEVVLLKISCQSCGEEFKVQMSTSSMHAVKHSMIFPDLPYRDLAAQVRAGSIHYGDPPRHDYNDNCGAGASMNCWDLAVLEFWVQGDRKQDEWGMKRVPELEIDLPDLKDPER